MSKLFDDTMQGLLEAVEIQKGNIPVKEREGMPARTFYVPNDDEEIINRLIELRKTENISQVELAEMTGCTQQAISRFEKKTHSPSLKLFVSVANALGYEIQFVKKA